MARGWESKSVEEQISEKERSEKADDSKVTAKQAAGFQGKRESLLLARTHTITSLESARDPRYRALLERTLAHLDAQLNEIKE